MESLDIFSLICILNFGLQLLFGGLSILFSETVKIFDLVGGLSHVLCAIVGLFFNKEAANKMVFQARVIQAICILIWSCRLTTFMMYRTFKNGKNSRLVDLQNPFKLMAIWILQGVWVLFNILPSLFLWTSTKTNLPVNFLTVIGWVIFFLGLVFETVADYQKVVFRSKPENKESFISTGLWSISRHPNYFGEIALWFGLFIAAAPYYSSQWAYFALFCPITTAFQLCFLSGIPRLEKYGIKKWGNNREYARYVNKTGVLIPWLICCECTPLPNKELLIDAEEFSGISGLIPDMDEAIQQ